MTNDEHEGLTPSYQTEVFLDEAPRGQTNADYVCTNAPSWTAHSLEVLAFGVLAPLRGLEIPIDPAFSVPDTTSRI